MCVYIYTYMFIYMHMHIYLHDYLYVYIYTGPPCYGGTGGHGHRERAVLLAEAASECLLAPDAACLAAGALY